MCCRKCRKKKCTARWRGELPSPASRKAWTTRPTTCGCFTAGGWVSGWVGGWVGGWVRCSMRLCVCVRVRVRVCMPGRRQGEEEEAGRGGGGKSRGAGGASGTARRGGGASVAIQQSLVVRRAGGGLRTGTVVRAHIHGEPSTVRSFCVASSIVGGSNDGSLLRCLFLCSVGAAGGTFSCLPVHGCAWRRTLRLT
jgi:hypothetical protein